MTTVPAASPTRTLRKPGGFDSERYLAEQSAAILDRVKRFDNKLYLEFGGKLLYDYHAARVLPGFDPNVKIRLLQKLADKAEVVLCIFAGDIERKKMRAASALVLNAVKHLAALPDSLHLLPPNIIASLSHFKKDVLQGSNISLDLEEALVALSISATFNPGALSAVEKLQELRGCEVHLTHMPTPGDEAGLRKLGVNLTSDPNFATKQFFIT